MATNKFYITRYALSMGIKTVVAEDPANSKWPHMLTVTGFGAFHGKDWHRTPEAALARAEEMRTAKLKSLEKSMKKVAQLTFNIGPQ